MASAAGWQTVRPTPPSGIALATTPRPDGEVFAANEAAMRETVKAAVSSLHAYLLGRNDSIAGMYSGAPPRNPRVQPAKSLATTASTNTTKAASTPNRARCNGRDPAIRQTGGRRKP
ncbi:hypothetical protein LTR29_011899 [Friedmanniomyces endolithicus]|nr:hypothetical protein LTR29_011899 [Friedmanniomyces endolithicus]